MPSVVVFGAGDPEDPSHPLARTALASQYVELDGIRIPCGRAPLRPPERRAPNPRQVLVRVLAFSCNYRDRTLCTSMRHVAPRRYSAIGSEFVAHVVAVGAAVRTLQVGDVVIPDHTYTGHDRAADGYREGVASNQSSREFQWLDERKLFPVPSSMPLEVAAAFGLNAQTAYSMVRRLDPTAGMRVLVTSATSNAGMSLVTALAARGCAVWAVTGNPAAPARLRELGATEVLVSAASRAATVAAAGERCGGFDAVLDPFFDVHAGSAIRALRPFGTYMTCGLFAQGARAGAHLPRLDGSALLACAMISNVTIVGNCLGTRADLACALADYQAGRYAVVVDSVYEGDQVAGFLHRTFNDGGRFGKAIFRYAD